MSKSEFIRCKECLTHQLSMLKPKFSVRCKNCLQHRPTRTDYAPRTSSDEEQVEAAAKIVFLPSHLDDPPAVLSSNKEEEETISEEEEAGGGGAEEEEEEEEEEESSSEEDEAEAAAKIESLPFTPPVKPHQEEEEAEEAGEEEEEEGEGEQSLSEEDEAEAAAKIESLPSTPPVKPHSSSYGSETKATQARSTKKKKRPNCEIETTPPKRVKQKDPDPEPKSQGGGGEKKLFQRLWSNEYEMELLTAMLDYKNVHDSDPGADAAAFYDFVKNSLQITVTKAQLIDKMKRLRKKYRNNAGRGKKGKDPTFSKPHERNTYELSKKIWGCAAADGASGRCLNGMLSFNKNVVLDESLIKSGLELIGQQKRQELEERWKRLELAKLQMLAAHAELFRDQANLIPEAFKGH
ncbi:probable transcription factor At1g11510 [Quercus lobata]|uniref:Glabrous enhancer-binding protein-like DBD domain-containing protein n=1 Tax=Quercus lobata TaxID=97700 RepID=A0A7N2N5R5_QUELO|nr:probable transcription factor At1g11510 [Quercus lobata]